jgi:hypothetical protein
MRGTVAVYKLRKKRCPYCEKWLRAQSKRRWRNNLARHLQNCLPFQREWISMVCRFVFEFLGQFPELMSVQPSSLIEPRDHSKADLPRSHTPNPAFSSATKKREVEALEKIWENSK